jgi:hypothetical protein
LTTRVDPLDTKGRDRAIFLSSQHPEVIEEANRSVSSREHASMPALVEAATRLVDLDLQLESGRSSALRKSGPPVTVAVLDRDGFRLAVPGVCGAVPPVR